jgi:hypothetical protein
VPILDHFIGNPVNLIFFPLQTFELHADFPQAVWKPAVLNPAGANLEAMIALPPPPIICDNALVYGGIVQYDYRCRVGKSCGKIGELTVANRHGELAWEEIVHV